MKIMVLMKFFQLSDSRRYLLSTNGYGWIGLCREVVMTLGRVRWFLPWVLKSL